MEEDIPKEQIEKILKENPINRNDTYLDLTKNVEKVPPKTTSPKVHYLQSQNEANPKPFNKDVSKGNNRERVLSHPFNHPKPEGVSHAVAPPGFKKSKIIIVLVVAFFILELAVLGIWAISSYNGKDYNINVNTPENPTTNQYEHTIVNNNTIIVELDDNFAQQIANMTIAEVRKQLNVTD